MLRSDRAPGWRVLTWGGLVLALGACASSRPPADKGAKDVETEKKATTAGQAAVKRWRVFDGEQLIMEVSDAPGPLISVAAPPPGLRPIVHPFLSAASRSAHHEHRLKEILDASTSAADFLEKLRAAGFEVVPVEPVGR